jgi:hypothetical protein
MTKGLKHTCMKVSLLGLCFLIVSVQGSAAPQKQENPATVSRTKAEQEIVSLSKEKHSRMQVRLTATSSHHALCRIFCCSLR